MFRDYTINYGYGIAKFTTFVPQEEVEKRFLTLANTCFGIRKSIMDVSIESTSEPSCYDHERLYFNGDLYIWREDGARKMILPFEDEDWDTSYCETCGYFKPEERKTEETRTPMTMYEYQKEALRTELPKDAYKSSAAILRVLAVLGAISDPDENVCIPRLTEGLMGLNGEAGEALDILKKSLFQGHKLDREHIARELGDVAWYLVLAADSIGYSLEDICRINIAKLRERYPNGFEAEKSVNRDLNDI